MLEISSTNYIFWHSCPLCVHEQMNNQGFSNLLTTLRNKNIPEYDQFAVDNESQNNKLKTLQFLSNISTVGDSLLPSWDNTNGISFSTYDHDYDSYTLNYHST
ncbi:unnamed protein product [Rotaria sp. Silwood2]|nr:unnamed protein product [Rotaria sp. Silwood2]CAF4444888.1 unnamed protein product [Rotaria sp. Silwood2]CAF4554262.1 unnamed protein product [Rotaria sp. Silwood2]